MLIFNISILIVSILLFCVGIYFFSHTHKINKQVDKENQELQDKNDVLKDNNSALLQMYENYKFQAEKEKENLNNLREAASTAVDNQKELSQKAFENYCAILEKNYEEKEKELKDSLDLMEKSYSNKQLELVDETNGLEEVLKEKISSIQAELDKIQATRAAALQAQLKEKEIKEQLAFYCLTISQTNLDDIKILERIKPQLHTPRILSMLIWQTYYQKPMTTLCNNILGTKTVCGIYKITNQVNGMCYIGQSVDCSKRWKDHAKCGLGIDAPVGNKLYKAMQEVGLYNFSFELLEACPRDQLNEKEKYYINLYQSNEYGYNILKGIN